MSRDPIGFGGGEWNVYGYVGARPTGGADPSGLQCRAGYAPKQGAIFPGEPPGRVDPARTWGNRRPPPAWDRSLDSVLRALVASGLFKDIGRLLGWNVGPVGEAMVRNGQANAGRKFIVDTDKVFRALPRERAWCAEKLRCLAEWAEASLPEGQDWYVYGQWHGGYSIQHSVFDIGYAIGGYSAYPQARVYRNGDTFCMVFLWVLTDTFTFENKGAGIADRVNRLHGVALDRDFWVDGYWSRAYKWQRGQRASPVCSLEGP